MNVHNYISNLNISYGAQGITFMLYEGKIVMTADITKEFSTDIDPQDFANIKKFNGDNKKD